MSSRASRTRTARPCSSARRRAAAATGESALPPKAPPLASGDRRLTTRLAPRGVGLEVGGLDPRRAQGEVPVARRARPGAAGLDGGAAALHLARRLAGLGQGLADRLAPLSVGHGHQRVGRGRVVGEAAGPRATSGPTRCGPPPSMLGPTGGGVEVTGRDGRAEPDPAASWIGAPPGAAAEVGSQGLVHRGLVGQVGALAPGPLEAHDDPRRAEAALAGPGGTEGVGPRVPIVGVRPSRVVIDGRPPAGPGSRRPPGGRRRPAPCSSRTGPGGCSRPWPSAGPRRSRSTSSREAPSSGTSTWAPSTSNCRTAARGWLRAHPRSGSGSGPPMTAPAAHRRGRHR